MNRCSPPFPPPLRRGSRNHGIPASLAPLAQCSPPPCMLRGRIAQHPASQSLQRRRRRSPDPRVGLKAGLWDAGEAAWNMRLVSNTPALREVRRGRRNSDLAFLGNYVIQGNYCGYPDLGHLQPRASPTLKVALRLSGVAERRVGLQEPAVRVREATTGRLDCGTEGVQGHGEPGAYARYPHLRHQRHRASEVRRQRADLPRLAHAHGARSIRRTRTTSTSTSRARRGVRSPNELRGLLERGARPGSELGAVPHRGDQGAARASGAGRDRQLAADLRRSEPAPPAHGEARAGHRRREQGAADSARAKGALHGGRARPQRRAPRRSSSIRCSTAS